MNSYELNNLCIYIASRTDFPFDTLDLSEELDTILSYFGYTVILTESEQSEIQKILYPRALAFELSEVQRLSERQMAYLMGEHVTVPGPMLLMAFRQREQALFASQDGEARPSFGADEPRDEEVCEV